MADDRTCFQCGKPRELVYDEKAVETGWFCCEWCGERLMKVDEIMNTVAENEEERIKRNLGFYDFKPKRR